METEVFYRFDEPHMRRGRLQGSERLEQERQHDRSAPDTSEDGQVQRLLGLRVGRRRSGDLDEDRLDP